MNDAMTLPRAARPFIDFPHVLRAHGFAVSPDQTVGFIEAVGLLGPRGMDDIRRAALAMLAIPHERESEFNALFRAFFMGQAVSAPVDGEDDEEVEAFEPKGGESEAEQPDEQSDVGAEAASAERLSQRTLRPLDDEEALARFIRLAPNNLPLRRTRRRKAARRGTNYDMRRMLREAVRRDGEVFTLSQSRRKLRHRRIVLLIDVSGSMKERTDMTMRFAHALSHAAGRFEAFTFGTRLTRITPALALANLEQALGRVSSLVADFDGGTRIGDALQALLAVPRFAGFARGALVVVLSDGLERGAPDAFVDAVRRLSRLAWRLEWLSPLAGEADYEPKTEALRLALPHIDHLGDANRMEPLCARILTLSKAAA